MGNLLGIVVHAANIHDTKSGILAAQKACKKYPSIQAFCADAGYRGTCIDEVKVTLHNSAARLAMSFPPSAACKFLDLHPVNLRNLHLHLTKNPFASRPPHLCGVTLIVSAEAEMLRLFLYSKIHAKYRKPIDMVGNIVYDDVVGFEQTRSREVAQNAEPELSERTVRQSNATLPDKAVWSGASFCVPLSRSTSSLTSTICPGVCEEQAPVIFWSNPQFLKTYRHKST